MRRILSFDQSTRITGWSLFDCDKYIDSGVIDLHKITDTSERSKIMGLEICKLIDGFMPDLIVIEEVQQQSNVDTVKKLARIQGMAIGFATAHKIDVKILEPSKWRSKLGYKQGRGVERKELKQQSIDFVKNNFGFEYSEDICEAISINVAMQRILEQPKDIDIEI